MVNRKGLGQANILRTNNNTSTGYGIVYADEVSGHRTVANLTALYALHDWQLSASGDNTGSDAIGQLWYVVNADGNGNGCYYQLKDWSKRNEAAGWSIADYTTKAELQDKIDNIATADEEDITTEGDTPQTQVLKLKDRTYDSLNASGKGYKILRKNWQSINGERKNVLTQEMINEPNTVYEIRYDFDLNETEISVKDNCVLKFNGGSVSNGTINGDCFEINATFFKIFSNIKFKGNFAYNNRVYVDWWISTPLYKFKNYIDQSSEIQECLDCGAENIVFSAERYYYISKTLVIEGEVNLFSTNEIKHYTGHDRSHRKEPPCIHTKEVITMLDYRFLGALAKGTITIGHLDFVVETPYTDFRDKDTPVIYIHGSEKTQYNLLWGLSFHANVKSDDWAVNLDEVYKEQGVTGAGSKNIPSFTGLKIVSDYVNISYVKIHGYLDHFYKCIVAESTTNKWFTDIEIYADTWGCIGGLFSDGIFPIRIFGSHQVINYVPKSLRDNGYFEGSWINLYGYVWDVSDNASQQMYSVKSPVYIKTLSFNSHINDSFSDTAPYHREYPAKIFNCRKFDVAITYMEDILPNALNKVSAMSTWRNPMIKNLSFTLNGTSYKNLKIYNNHVLFGERLIPYTTTTLGLLLQNNFPYILKTDLSSIVQEDNIIHCVVQFDCNIDLSPRFSAVQSLIVRREYPITNFAVTIGDVTYPISGTEYYEQQAVVVTKALRKGLVKITYDIDISKINGNYVQFPIIKVPYYCISDDKVFETLPIVEGHPELGLTGFCSTFNKPVWLSRNNGFVLADGYPAKFSRKDDTVKRPALTSSEEGFEYYDTTLKKKILWNGTAWVNMDGSSLG